MAKQAIPPLHLHPLAPLAPVEGVGPGVGLAFVQAYFPRIQQAMRIATAYFSLKGYNMAFPYLPANRQVKLKILVGKRDGYQLKRTVLEDMRLELQRGVKLASLYDAVYDLYQRMQAGDLTICDARQMERPFHCKFYLSDADSVFHGSANFSANGLRNQAEQLSYSTDIGRVADWTKWFEEVAAGAVDLQADLRKLLADWLAMATPFQVYLKALEALLSPMRELNHKGGAHAPIPFQRVLAAWAARQLVEHRGALLVVATGLGKTIIGAETVGQLWRVGHIDRIILLAPPLVHDAWRTQLKGRGMQEGRHYVLFGLKALFRIQPVPGGQAAQLLAELQQAGPGTLIMIDEAHEFRNQHHATQAKLHNKHKKRDNASSGSIVYDRLHPALAAGMHALLLTGSAYGTSRLNFNSLLRLLPPTAPLTEKPEASLLNEPEPNAPQHWSALSPAGFGLLPVVAVFTYPHALYLAKQEQPTTEDEESQLAKPPYLPFTHGPGYLPLDIHTENIYYSPPHWQELLAAFDNGCFAQEEPITTEGYTDETGPVIGKTDVIGKHALEAWISSPAALREAITQNLASAGPVPKAPGQIEFNFQFVDSASDTIVTEQSALWEKENKTRKRRNSKANKRAAGAGYGTSLRLAREERHRQLTPILALLEGPASEDEKLVALGSLLRKICITGKGQAIIFVRWHETAAYLGEQLQAALKRAGLRVACCVNPRGELRSLAERQRLREEFAPVANNTGKPFRYHILVCTDADSVGVNLQDAEHIINYDWPVSADGLVQRFGRILRPAPYANRVPHIYTFIPECLQPPRTATVTSRTVQAIGNLFDRLVRRHDASSKLLGFPLLSTEGASRIPLDVPIDPAALDHKLSEKGDEISTPANNWTTHINAFEEHKDSLEQLPTIVHSARLSPHRVPRIIVLLRYKNGVVPIVYDIEADRLVTMHELPILNLLRADLNEKAAGVNLPRIMRYADHATRRWCERVNIKPSRTKRIAAVYLHPQHQAEDFDYLLKVE